MRLRLLLHPPTAIITPSPHPSYPLRHFTCLHRQLALLRLQEGSGLPTSTQVPCKTAKPFMALLQLSALVEQQASPGMHCCQGQKGFLSILLDVPLSGGCREPHQHLHGASEAPQASENVRKRDGNPLAVFKCRTGSGLYTLFEARGALQRPLCILEAVALNRK